jgi:hypothetical protein
MNTIGLDSSGLGVEMSNATYIDNRAFSDAFTPKIKEIVGRVLCSKIVTEASKEDDCHKASDLILAIDKVRIACRVRRAKECYDRFKNEFTLRAFIQSGNGKTEMEKIIGGWGDYIFYGFGNDESRFIRWFIGDLREFREWHYRCVLANGKSPGEYKANRDGTGFFAFNLLDLNKKSRFVVSWYGYEKDATEWPAIG